MLGKELMVPRDNGRLTLEERRFILERDNYTCTNCGRGGRNSDWILEVDHVNGNGKEHKWDNLRTVCVECHNNKHPWRWAIARFKYLTFRDRKKALGF